jgi:hypothetical protein
MLARASTILSTTTSVGLCAIVDVLTTRMLHKSAGQRARQPRGTTWISSASPSCSDSAIRTAFLTESWADPSAQGSRLASQVDLPRVAVTGTDPRRAYAASAWRTAAGTCAYHHVPSLSRSRREEKTIGCTRPPAHIRATQASMVRDKAKAGAQRLSLAWGHDRPGA